jgi:hypothetical protein
MKPPRAGKLTRRKRTSADTIFDTILRSLMDARGCGATAAYSRDVLFPLSGFRRRKLLFNLSASEARGASAAHIIAG